MCSENMTSREEWSLAKNSCRQKKALAGPMAFAIHLRKAGLFLALRQVAMVNTMESFSYVFLKALEGIFIDRMDQNEEITAKFMNEKKFRGAVGQTLLKQVCEQIRAEETTECRLG
jgi:hypothetical protein